MTDFNIAYRYVAELIDEFANLNYSKKRTVNSSEVKKILRAEDISIGDYVVTGGELPAMIIIDVVARQIKGVLGKEESIEENRVSISEVYTRPEILKYPLLQSGRRSRNYKVPKVLLSGDHKKIEDWKKWKS